ncbi:MAG TPA: TIGR01777 family protein [Anaerolineae bacterium]|nr:TIGR01777 family protein [Caldilineae bacterium]HID35089.1 TIGR01777 family protein [Anaerolineae bacterium]HIQ12615.1 TIGR01777 family protein [Caldilineales bacterium]
MRILITGGTGLIGRALIDLLLPEGHEIIVLSRNPARVTLPAGVQVAGWDARSAQGWAHLAEGADAIVNLAGESIAGAGAIPARWTAARKRRILESRLNATRAVVEAIDQARAKPKVLVQGSAVGYYGGRVDDVALDEDAAPGDDFLAEVAVQWEAASAPVEAMGVRRALARTGLVLSATGGSLPPTLLPFKLFLGGPLGHGLQWWPWIHIRDEVRALVFLITEPRAAGPFNLTAPNPVTNRAFARVLGKVMRRPSLLPAPAFLLRLALGEMADLLLKGQRALPKRLLELGFEFEYPHLEGALRDLLGR